MARWLTAFLFLAGGLVVVCSVFAAEEQKSEWPDWTVVNVAHAGGIVPGYPENTLAAFRRSVSLGVDAIELDLRGTRDGEVVIIHDETVDRTTNGKGKVTDYTLQELKQLDAGGGESIPTYAEALDVVAGTGITLLLDIKISPQLDKRKVVRLTEEHGALLNVIAGVRTLEDLKQFRKLNPNIRILGFIAKPGDADDFIAGGADIIRLWPEWIQADKTIVQKIQARGKPVWTTATDSRREALEELIRSGVNGILCNYPKVMSKLLSDIEASKAHPESKK